MTGQTAKEKRTALYCRLSKDDGNYGDSSSIQTQKEILARYATDNGFGNISYYVDDGYSGTNFNRPDFQRLLTDIENGEISVLITKDLSRLGRNYLETGVYLELYFPEHNVRYIAINDSVDTINTETVDYTPFRNIANELYAKDTSKKIRSAKRARMQAGMYVAPLAPYGYKKDPADYHRLVIDERYAPNVRRIFELAKEGLGVTRIAGYMNAQHILTPGAVNETGGFERWYNGADDPKRYEWGPHAIRNILRNPVYAGHLVTNKVLKPSFKSKKRFSVLPENYIIVENIHEPIVSPQDFELVQKLITSHRCTPDQSDGWENIFAGLIKCEDCGRSMSLHKTKRIKRDDPIDMYCLMCNTYKTHGTSDCTAHKVEVRDLYQEVLADIRRHARAAFKDDAKMTDNLLKQLGAGKKKQSGIITKELKEKKTRLSEVDRLFQKLYEDRVKGNISDRNYQMMNQRYEEEQTALQRRIEEISTLLIEEDSKSDNAEQFIKLIKEYAGIKKLDAALLNTLVEKITVGEKKETEDGATQEIKIYYKFIGNIS